MRDMIVDLKRAALETRARSALDTHDHNGTLPADGLHPADVTVNTPVPFSIHKLWLDLHKAVDATHTASKTAQSRETEALLLGEDGEPLEAGDAMKVIPPRYRPATQAAGEEKIFLSSNQLKIHRQVDALASRLEDRRYDFLFRPGPYTPDPDGEIKSDLDAFLESWIGSSRTVSILDLSGVPTEISEDLVGALTRVIYDALLWSRRLSEGGRERPLLFVFEEAHAYLGNVRPEKLS